MTLVAVCIPCFDMVPQQFSFALAALTYSSNLPLMLVRGQSSVVAHARNNCLAAIEQAEAQGNQVTHIFFLDSDVIVPADALKRLVKHDKDIVAGSYRRRSPPFELMGTTLDHQPAKVETGLLEMERLPTGCMLIKRRVFANMMKPYFRYDVDGEEIITEDVTFCQRARANGFKVWLDVDLTKEIAHLYTGDLKVEEERASESISGMKDKINKILDGEVAGHG